MAKTTKRRTHSAVSATVGVTASKPSTTASVAADDEPLVGPADIAVLLGVPVSWVYTKSEEGELPSYKLGHYRRYRPTEIREYLRARRSTPNGR